MSTANLLVVGSMNMDLVLEADRIPLPGESYFGTRYHTILGGKGANQATAAARMGGHVTFCGRVGDDPNGRKLIEGLEASGVDTGGVAIDPVHPSGLAVIIVEPDGSNRIMVYSGANMQIDIENVRPFFDSDYDAVLISLEIPDVIATEVCRLAERRSIPVIVDAGPARSFPLKEFVGVAILSPNETEARALTGISCDTHSSQEEAARFLLEESGAKHVVIKLGEEGSIAFDGVHIVRHPAYPVEVVDTTAAGDAFTAALAIQYLETGDVAASLDLATAAGALAISRLGAQPSLPGRAEAEKFLREQLAR